MNRLQAGSYLHGMRRLFLLGFFSALACAAAPPELTAALKKFQTDAPAGWSFTQTTVGEGKSTVERCDAAKPEFDRWTLVQQDGRAPTLDETKRYAENRSRRSRGGVAPKIASQLNLAAVEMLNDTTERVTFRCPLKRLDNGDKTADALRATIVVHKPTKTIESFELGAVAEFKPTFGVSISEMRTTMAYSVPTDTAPSLPQKVSVRVRGRAFFVKSLDADMTVTFSDYARAGKK